MLIRLFEGRTWSEAVGIGDMTVAAPPSVGDVLAISTGDDATWRVGRTLSVAHRSTDPDVEADVALLVSPMASEAATDAPLPFETMDRAGDDGDETGRRHAAPSTAAPSSAGGAGPWG